MTLHCGQLGSNRASLGTGTWPKGSEVRSPWTMIMMAKEDAEVGHRQWRPEQRLRIESEPPMIDRCSQNLLMASSEFSRRLVSQSTRMQEAAVLRLQVTLVRSNPSQVLRTCTVSSVLAGTFHYREVFPTGASVALKLIPALSIRAELLALRSSSSIHICAGKREERGD